MVSYFSPKNNFGFATLLIIVLGITYYELNYAKKNAGKMPAPFFIYEGK